MEKEIIRHDEDNELRRLNDELLKRRSEAKAEAMNEYGDKLSEVRQHLEAGKHDTARQLAEGLRDTLLFREVIKAFHDRPKKFHCRLCGSNIEAVRFKEDTLTWVRPSICGDCEDRERKSEMEKEKRLYADFVERNIDRILNTVGVEGILLKASYAGFPKEVVQACKRSTMSKKLGLYITGGVGRGKSWLSVATLKDLIKTIELPKELRSHVKSDISYFKDYYRFVYVNWLLMIIKSSYETEDSQTEQAIITEYTNIPVLVLDDIGAERPTEWVREKLNMIIYFRNNKGLKTLFTSNYEPAELQERLDERISSRIHQQCQIIKLTGPDRRLQ